MYFDAYYLWITTNYVWLCYFNCISSSLLLWGVIIIISFFSFLLLKESERYFLDKIFLKVVIEYMRNIIYLDDCECYIYIYIYIYILSAIMNVIYIYEIEIWLFYQL